MASIHIHGRGKEARVCVREHDEAEGFVTLELGIEKDEVTFYLNTEDMAILCLKLAREVAKLRESG